MIVLVILSIFLYFRWTTPIGYATYCTQIHMVIFWTIWLTGVSACHNLLENPTVLYIIISISWAMRIKESLYRIFQEAFVWRDVLWFRSSCIMTTSRSFALNDDKVNKEDISDGTINFTLWSMTATPESRIVSDCERSLWSWNYTGLLFKYNSD